jgi:SAM-dependent methyltransferase
MNWCGDDGTRLSPASVPLFLAEKDLIRGRLLKYLRRAYRSLPLLEKPRILDIGCGRGVPTLELARLSGGTVTAVDIDPSAIAALVDRAEQAGLPERVRTVCCSLHELAFADFEFDIIWADGSIYAIGFEKGLRAWGRLLRRGGFLVVHDSRADLIGKKTLVYDCGYDLTGVIEISPTVWQLAYFAPLERLVHKFQIAFPGEQALERLLNQARAELDEFRRNPGNNSSAYFIMRKTGVT